MTAPAEDGSSDLRQPQVVNHLYGPVDAAGAVFGTARLPPDRKDHGAIQGLISPAEIEQFTRTFVPPAGFQDAVERLERDHLVVLHGPAGSGKGTSAVALLDAVGVQDQVHLLPIIRLHDLSGREFAGHHGYLILDWEVEQSRSDVRWLDLRRRLSEAGAFLVISTSQPVAEETINPSVRLRLARPDQHRVVSAHLGAGSDQQTVARLVAGLPPAISVSDVAAAADLVAAGEPIETVLGQVHTEANQVVHTWWEAATTAARLEVAALAFLDGATQHTFEEALGQLHLHLSPLWADDGPSNVVQLRSRRDRLAENSLMRSEPDPFRGRRSRLVFKSPGYRVQVMRELADQSSPLFWEALRAWVDEVLSAETCEWVTAGLAVLADVDVEQVERSYLDRWSARTGDVLWQRAAAQVLAWMCENPSLRNTALLVIERWTTTGRLEQRRAAAICLCGPLGLLYPFESARRLWDILVHGPVDAAGEALAHLFSLTASSGPVSNPVLRVLRSGLTNHGHSGADDPVRDRLLDAVLKVLAVTDPDHSGFPSVALMVHRDPRRIELAAEVWRGVYANSTTRAAASRALHRIAAALDRLGDEKTSAALIEKLALNGAERRQLDVQLESTEDPAGRSRRLSQPLGLRPLPVATHPGTSED